MLFPGLAAVPKIHGWKTYHIKPCWTKPHIQIFIFSLLAGAKKQTVLFFKKNLQYKFKIVWCCFSRAGRCSPGVCFHLFSRIRYESLQEYQLPELLRVPLQVSARDCRQLYAKAQKPCQTSCLLIYLSRSVSVSFLNLVHIFACLI